MADGDGQAGLSSQAGQFGLPCSQPIAVGPAGIGGDQQSGGVGEAPGAHLVPPSSDRFDRELGGVCAVADVDPALVVGDIVDAVRDGLGELVQVRVGEVMHLDPLGVACRRPLGTAVGVVAQQFLFLGVDTDNRLAVVDEPIRLGVDVAELSVTVGMLATLVDLGVGLQRVAQTGACNLFCVRGFIHLLFSWASGLMLA